MWPETAIPAGLHFFSERQPDWQNNACVGKQVSRDSGHHYYCDGFRHAANCLVERLLDKGRHDPPIDLIVYPVVFLYRHHFELLLKQLHIEVLPEKDWPHGHSLMPIWKRIREHLPRQLPDADWSQLERVDLLVSELEQVDPQGQAGRYYLDKHGMAHFEHLKVLNVREFAYVASLLSEYLCEIFNGLMYTREAESQWQDEASEYNGDY